MSRGMWSLWALTGIPVTNVNIPASDSDATSAPRKLSEMNASRGCSALRFRQTRHVRMPRPDMAQLVTHEYTHQDGPLPFRCETCSKYCKTKNALRNHMRQHTGEKPYPCRHCSISFSNHTNRQRHEMNHTGNKPFACSFCDRKFTINRLKLEHECKHTGVKPFKCSFCEKSFIRKRFQLDHEATHTGEKPYRCEVPSCNRTFSQQAPLRRHMVTHRTEGSAEFFPLNQQTPNVSILPSSSSV
ncbi:zinc finger protein [Culex quinquefasciatus]|uniref:Zinc finger protein n=1 Tax=Culex quinquefasciatus TaxID=7176 RepID=B0X5Z1_CULQU|nr:zinc finger protein [Culex quinquefasciatus]|eukprot:XP_001865063.1 zinc finger protein [Culex quinquefasciatus]